MEAELDALGDECDWLTGWLTDEDELEAELDALGDEIGLDADTSYLDEASRAPNAPTGVPGAESNKVGIFSLPPLSL